MILLSFLFTNCEEPCVKNTFPENFLGRGCGDFFVYDEVTPLDYPFAYLIVEGKRASLDLTESFKTFDARDTRFGLRIEQLNREGNDYCTDALLADLEVLSMWLLVEGSLEMRVVRESTECDQTYVIDLNITNAIFENENGERYTIPTKQFRNVYVNYGIG